MIFLNLAIWLPILAGVVLLALGRDDNARAVRWMALVFALASFLVTIPLITGFDTTQAGMQFQTDLTWIERFNAHYHLGVDGISVWFVLLTALITVIVVISAWEVITERVNQYMGAFLILSGLMIGVFAAVDGLLFYTFFEATLIPMYIIIGVWGGPKRIYASFKFFLYTLLGSLLMLVALVYLYIQSNASFDILAWHKLPLSMTAQTGAVLRVPRRVRGQGADVPGAHVAARRPRRGAHRRLRRAGRDHAEAGRVRLPALLAADRAGRQPPLGLADHRAVADRRRLHRPRRHGADRHEEAGRLFVDRPHGLLHAGLLHLQLAGHAGRHRADDLARLRLGRHVPVHRRAVRPRPLARHRGLRRRRQHDADGSPPSPCCSRWPTAACRAPPGSSASGWSSWPPPASTSGSPRCPPRR